MTNLVSKVPNDSLDNQVNNKTRSRTRSTGSFEMQKFFTGFFSTKDDSCSLASFSSINIPPSVHQPQEQNECHQVNHEHFRKVQEEMRRARVFTNASARLLHEKILNDCPTTKTQETSTDQTSYDGFSTNVRRISAVKEALLSFVGNLSGECQLDESYVFPTNYSASNIQFKRNSNDHESYARKSSVRQDDRRQHTLKMHSESSFISLSSKTLFSVERGNMICDFKQDCQNSSVLICDFKKEMNESALSIDDEEFSSDHHFEGDRQSNGNDAFKHAPARMRVRKRHRLARRLSITLKQVENLIDSLDENNSIDNNREAETTLQEDKDLFTLMQEAGAIPCVEQD